MARLAGIISAPMSKATSIVVLAGCLLLGFLVGMSPMYTSGGSDGSSRRSTNLRTGSNTATTVGSVPPATPEQYTSNRPEMPTRLAEAKLFNVEPQDLAVDTDNEVGSVQHHELEPQKMAVDNKEDAGGVRRFESQPPGLYEDAEPFFWGDQLPDLEGFDLNQFTVPVEESLAAVDSSFSYDLVGLDLVGLSASPFSFSYEF